MGKTGRKNKNYSAEFKLCVIMHHLGYYEIVRKYWDITQGQEQNYHATVKKWERIFLEEGSESLMKEKRGRACKINGSNKGRPPKLDKKLRKILLPRTKDSEWR